MRDRPPATAPCPGHHQRCHDRNRARSMVKRILPVEVFLANAREIGVRKRAICERHGHGDVLLADEKDLAIRPSPTEQELAVSRAMERVMQGCKGAAP